MTESNLLEIESVESVNEIRAASSDYSDDPLVARVQKAMEEIGEAEAKRKAEEEVLDELILSKIVEEDDPFIAMMNAMLVVIPQLMKCKEELLVVQTANFDYISSLNAYMAETQQYFSYGADKGEPIFQPDPSQGDHYVGETTYWDSNGRVRGYGAAKAYMDNLSTIREEKLFGGLAPDVQKIMNEAVKTSMKLVGYAPEISSWKGQDIIYQTEYDLPRALWGGLNGPNWIMQGDDRYTNKNYGYTTGNEDLFQGHGETAAAYLTGQLSQVVDDAVTQNTILENTLNGYSKQTEAKYKYEFESYNTIVNTDAQMYQAQINQNKASSKRLRAV